MAHLARPLPTPHHHHHGGTPIKLHLHIYDDRPIDAFASDHGPAILVTDPDRRRAHLERAARLIAADLNGSTVDDGDRGELDRLWTAIGELRAILGHPPADGQ